MKISDFTFNFLLYNKTNRSYKAGTLILSLVKQNHRIKNIDLEDTKIQEGILRQINTQLDLNRYELFGCLFHFIEDNKKKKLVKHKQSTGVVG